MSLDSLNFIYICSLSDILAVFSIFYAHCTRSSSPFLPWSSFFPHQTAIFYSVFLLFHYPAVLVLRSYLIFILNSFAFLLVGKHQETVLSVFVFYNVEIIVHQQYYKIPFTMKIVYWTKPKMYCSSLTVLHI